MKKTIATIAGVAAALMLTAAPASADPFRPPPDPHIPNLTAGYCPGAKIVQHSSPNLYGYCDGAPYPDGSYWHDIQIAVPGRTDVLQCVINPGGGPVPQPAPSGGCDGAV